MTDWQPTACILCSRNCGLQVQVADGHLTKIRGDKNHPVSAGYICQKAAQLDHYQNNADRLTQPLKRQEDGSYQPIDWQTAITEIAARLLDLKQTYGKECLAFYGGGGQGNHLGSMYSSTFRDALEIPYYYSALAQEKTGDFWVNGKLFGRQNCHTTEDIEQTECVLFIGTNPWQAHGIRNARPTLKQIAQDDQRTMIVIDPRRTETAELADIHLQLRPGTDAFLLSAMLAILVQEGWEDQAFLQEHTIGYTEVRACLLTIPIADHIERAGVDADQVYEAVRRFATAKSANVRVDLGLQQSLNSTLNSYLEKLFFLLTGNLGKPGGSNFHTFFLPWVGHSDAEAKTLCQTKATGITEIAQLFPPNVLPAEIESDHPQRIRGLIVDSANPVVSGADTQAYQRAFPKLDLLVVVDVAMTETARYADYILSAASQFEKWEAAFFNLEFPTNAFHLRKPLFAPLADTLPESEIYRRLAVAIGAIPERYPVLEQVARWHGRWPQLGLYRVALVAAMALQPQLRRTVAFALQGSLGKTLPDDSIAPFWGVSQLYVQHHGEAVARTGLPGRGGRLAEALFQRILHGHSGAPISQHRYEETWALMGYKDQKVRLVISELIEELQTLSSHHAWPEYPLMLIAGERRMYNANTIYRNPQWRQNDAEGVLKIHPVDAKALALAEGSHAVCESPWGQLTVQVKLCDTLRPGVVSLPHGYGLDYPDANGTRTRYGPLLNLLTDAQHCDTISATPFHKNVPVRLRPIEMARAASLHESLP